MAVVGALEAMGAAVAPEVMAALAQEVAAAVDCSGRWDQWVVSDPPRHCHRRTMPAMQR
jgi:hypothetical protein